MSPEKFTPVRFFRGLSLLLFLMLQFSAGSVHAQYTKLADFGNTLNGFIPYSAPISDGTYLYGMTSGGGLSDNGIIYKIKLDGTGFTKFFEFDGNNGSSPIGSLFFDGSDLYGMASQGGANGNGTIFKVKTDGSGFTVILDFDYNTSGANPTGALISDGTYLYGMTLSSLTYGGIVFKIKKDGTGYSTLHSFALDNNGYQPYGSLYYDGTFLYGLTSGGGSFYGTMFKIKTDGTGFTSMVTFSNASTGLVPYGSLISDGTFLYGMTSGGPGFTNNGAIFKIKPDGTSFTKILDLNNTVPGASPRGSLVYDGTYLYGMTVDYGANTRGTIFKVKTDGTGMVKLRDNDIGVNGPTPEGTLLLQGGVLYGAKSGIGEYEPGAIFKINTDGSAYARLHTFEIEGSSPAGSLISDGTYLYGTTSAGGLKDYGTIFKVRLDGTGYTRLYDFLGNPDGRTPMGKLVSDGTFLYGMNFIGGANDEGSIFRIKTDGSAYSVLFSFTSATGVDPYGSLIVNGSFLYGTVSNGGSTSSGTIFKIGTDGSNFTLLRDLDYTNDGANPHGDLISDGTYLYGLTSGGGASGGWGTIFKIKPDGSGFVKLLDLDYTNTGSNPMGSLVYDGTSMLYGMTSAGGANLSGTIIKINTDGTGYAKLLDFDSENTGSSPNGSLVINGPYLYGMTSGGGTVGDGVLFRIKQDGTGFQKFMDFNDGTYPQGSLVVDGTFLYGMTESGGANSKGILFKSTFTPYATISYFEPASGIVGTYVTIHGTDFDTTPANNSVKFNGLPAKVISATASTLVVIVPDGADSGPIAVTANGSTGVSISDFTVTTQAYMINGKVQNCNADFIFDGSSDDQTETFMPVTPGDKVKVSFSKFDVDDILNIYDGPDTSSPLIVSLNGSTLPADIIATWAGGELTFEYVWEDSGSEWEANISCQPPGGPAITITPEPTDVTACAGDVAKFILNASGTSNLAFQWQFSTTKTGTFTEITDATTGYSGTTTATLKINTTNSFGIGFYRCSVSGDAVSPVVSSVAQLTVNTSGCGPAIEATTLSTQIGGTVTLDLVPLIATPNSTLDLTSLTIVTQPSSGASASIDASGRLSIDYSGKNFSGEDSLTIRACDTNGKCTTQVFTIEVGGDLTVFNGVSPNGNFFKIVNIEALPDTKNNTVYIFDRWENLVWHGSNYDNTTVKFTGVGDSGNELPSGVYFYKVEFASGHKKLAGFISVRK